MRKWGAPGSCRQRSDTGPGMIDTQAHSPSMVERGRAAGIQLGLLVRRSRGSGVATTRLVVNGGGCRRWAVQQWSSVLGMRSLLTGLMRRESHIPRGLARCTLRSTRRQRGTSLLELDSDVHARSSVASQQSLLATWTRLHVRWFGVKSPPFPTWPLIASQMKLAGYRSFGNYCGMWNQLLERVGADCVKSVMRGLGPGRAIGTLSFGACGRSQTE